MNKLFLLIIFVIIVSCSNNKVAYWCGDHPCVNKKEKEAYFKKTMIVEMKILDKNEISDNSDLEEVLKKAKINEKKRIKEEELSSKQAKIDEKNRIKEEKKLAKQAKIDEKNRIKEEKKLAKTKREREDNHSKEKTNKYDINTTKDIKIGSKVSIIGIDSNKFGNLVDKILKRNSARPFPDINDIPN